MATLNKINGEWVVTAGGQRMWVGTQAAYEAALANGEIAANTLVAITDDGGQPHRYSTDEQVVGTWINNKPIYEKTFTATMPNTTNATFATNVVGGDCEYVVSLVCRVVNGNNHVAIFAPDYGTGSVYYSIPNDSLLTDNLPAHAQGRATIITIQYTKTTD